MLKAKLISILISFMLLTLAGCSQQSKTVKIYQKPIKFDSTRAQLSIEYMANRYGMEKQTPTIDPQMVVVHWTAIPTFEKSFEFFYEPTLGPKRKDIQDASMLNVSSHYMIKRNGDIYQLLPDTLFARHVIGLNHSAIGIENVGTDTARLTEA
jgi:N-acetyl-anhydromuramyl-L-alanine amidase AmpD